MKEKLLLKSFGEGMTETFVVREYNGKMKFKIIQLPISIRDHHLDSTDLDIFFLFREGCCLIVPKVLEEANYLDPFQTGSVSLSSMGHGGTEA